MPARHDPQALGDADRSELGLRTPHPVLFLDLRHCEGRRRDGRLPGGSRNDRGRIRGGLGERDDAHALAGLERRRVVGGGFERDGLGTRLQECLRQRLGLCRIEL
jgi:hypothetical protein